MYKGINRRYFKIFIEGVNKINVIGIKNVFTLFWWEMITLKIFGGEDKEYLVSFRGKGIIFFMIE